MQPLDELRCAHSFCLDKLLPIDRLSRLSFSVGLGDIVRVIVPRLVGRVRWMAWVARVQGQDRRNRLDGASVAVDDSGVAGHEFGRAPLDVCVEVWLAAHRRRHG